ncbi:unnamed protein product [Darwinula stevensoni]|uniref:Proteasome adapter and scaffold protein ECM29 HEAT-repeat domain-containing protein n=1 Tax=Darwinula stevensoni TaxID=69355 RepID=A0A7R8XA26_9CRUS|nr:unnamed protein product [Darwinula stevensoni]CAG0890234.1 unnamed protein product [Darwinula stevensoni]
MSTGEIRKDFRSVGGVLEVGGVRIEILAKLCTTAGGALEPHVSALIHEFLSSMDSQEPTALLHLSSQLAGDQRAQEAMDRARVRKPSSLLDALASILPFVNEKNMEEVSGKLVGILRGHGGLLTKFNCAWVIQVLVSLLPKQTVEPYTGKILAALVHNLHDRNAVLRTVMAKTIGHIMKAAKDSSFQKLGEKITSWYLDKDDEETLVMCGLVVHYIQEHSADRGSSHYIWSLPLAFLAMHAKPPSLESKTEAKNSCDVWREVWNEGTPGTEIGLKLYATEIVDLIEKFFSSQSWMKKAQAGRALSSLLLLRDHLNDSQLKKISGLLMESLSGKTWDGKEAILEATKEFCSHATGKKEELRRELQLGELVDGMLKECRKNVNMSYKQHCLTHTAVALAACGSDKFSAFKELMSPILSQGQMRESNRMEEKGEEENDLEGSIAERENLLVCAWVAIGKAWLPTSQGAGEDLQWILEEIKNSLGKSSGKIVGVMRTTLSTLILNSLQAKELSAFDQAASLLTEVVSSLTSHLPSKSHDTLMETIQKRLNELEDAEVKLKLEAALQPLLQG